MFLFNFNYYYYYYYYFLIYRNLFAETEWLREARRVEMPSTWVVTSCYVLYSLYCDGRLRPGSRTLCSFRILYNVQTIVYNSRLLCSLFLSLSLCPDTVGSLPLHTPPSSYPLFSLFFRPPTILGRLPLPFILGFESVCPLLCS